MHNAWERKSFSRQTNQETLHSVLTLWIISVPSKSSWPPCSFRLPCPSQFFDSFLRERCKVSMSCKRLNQGAKCECQRRGLNAKGKKPGAALWFQISMTYALEPANNWAYPKRNQAMLSTNQLGFHFQLHFSKMFTKFAFLYGDFSVCCCS